MAPHAAGEFPGEVLEATPAANARRTARDEGVEHVRSGEGLHVGAEGGGNGVSVRRQNADLRLEVVLGDKDDDLYLILVAFLALTA